MKAIALLVGALVMQQSCGLTFYQLQNHQHKAMASSRFPHVHPDIVTILDCPPSTIDSNDGSRPLVHPETLEILWNPPPSDKIVTPVSTQLLVDLAYASDRALYQQEQHSALQSKVLQSLVAMGGTTSADDDCQIVAATLLALNRLESAIRSHTGYTVGKAPLLKTMVNQLEDSTLCSILMTLLLPVGLNFRNLLWHGFVAFNLSRRWLSLVVVLTHNLEATSQIHEVTEVEEYHIEESLENIMSHGSVQTLLSEQESSDDDTETRAIIKRWLPESHHGLLELALLWRTTKPACSIALLSIILEHGLRLDWCRLNDGQDSNAIAQPGAYYITLDGHGQKHQHDLLLFPYIGRDENQENQLIDSLGGGTVALLSDLYVSPCGGPNLRAALAHGLWDAQLDKELLQEEISFDLCHGSLVKMANLVLVAVKGAASFPSPALRRYHPHFSYRAVTLRELQSVMQQLERLDSLQSSYPLDTTAMMTNSDIATLNDSTFEKVASRVLQELKISSGDWNAKHVFQEHGINTVLVDAGASRSLLTDLVEVTSSFESILQEAIAELQSEESVLDRRQLKRLQRTCSVTDVTVKVYRFAALVAVLSIEEALRRNKGGETKRLPADVLLQAVQRSRMTVSTFNNFLVSNTDRSLKAAVDYTKGKAVKAILEYVSLT